MTGDTRGLTRRRVLGSVATLGVAAAAGGAGSLAFFSDGEEFANNRLVAGSLDLKLAWRENYFGERADEALVAGAYAPNGFFTADETTLEGYPTLAGGAGVEFEGLDAEDACSQAEFYADTPEDLDPTAPESFRPQNTDTYDADAGRPRPLISIRDAKPGDFGFTRFRLLLCDNPAYVWQTGGIQSLAENGTTEPERKDPDQPVGSRADGEGQLADTVRVRLFHDRTGVAVSDLIGSLGGASGQAFSQDVIEAFDLANAITLREFGDLLAEGTGIPLDADPFDGGAAGEVSDRNGNLFLYDLPQGGEQQRSMRQCFEPDGGADQLGVVWGLPVDHANEIQTDSVAVDVGFYVEQCRHNDGSDGSGMGNVDA